MAVHTHATEKACDCVMPSMAFSYVNILRDVGCGTAHISTVFNLQTPRTYINVHIYHWKVSVCLFMVNANTTARIDTKDPERGLCMLKSPVLVFSGWYRDISFFSLRPTAISTSFPFTSGSSRALLQKRKCNYTFACILQADMHRQVHVHAGMPCNFNHYMLHACFAHTYPEALSHCGHGHDLTSVAQLSVIHKADIRSAFDKTLASEHFRQNAIGGLLC